MRGQWWQGREKGHYLKHRNFARNQQILLGKIERITPETGWGGVSCQRNGVPEKRVKVRRGVVGRRNSRRLWWWCITTMWHNKCIFQSDIQWSSPSTRRSSNFNSHTTSYTILYCPSFFFILRSEQFESTEIFSSYSLYL